MIVVDVSPAVEEEVKPLALVNPEIVEKRGWVEGTEGCLSVPGVEGTVGRAESVVVRGRNEDGDPVTFEAYGLLSRAVQHEIDHLEGILFIDRLPAPPPPAQKYPDTAGAPRNPRGCRGFIGRGRAGGGACR